MLASQFVTLFWEAMKPLRLSLAGKSSSPGLALEGDTAVPEFRFLVVFDTRRLSYMFLKL